MLRAPPFRSEDYSKGIVPHAAATMLSVNQRSRECLVPTPPLPLEHWIAETRSMVDRQLDQLLSPPHASPVTEAMRYSVLAPGKRLRPLLMLAIAEFLATPAPGILRVACVIEMIHSASLVLDDLPCMDNDRERRSRLSTHAKFGEDLSILAAVSLLMQSHCLLASDDQLPSEARLKLIRLFCDTVGSSGLSLGQYIDLNPAQGMADTFSTADVHHLKTGILFVAAARAACLLCGAAPSQEAAVVHFATNLGLAFQAWDDLTDQDEAGSNLVQKIGVAGARQTFQGYLHDAGEAIDGYPNASILQAFADAMFVARLHSA